MIDLGRTRTVSGDITGALGQGPDIDGDRILYYGFPRGSGSNYGLYLIDLQQGTEVALTPGGYEPNMR